MTPRSDAEQQRYVVGIDGSSPGRAALTWALARWESRPGPIVLLTVAAEPSPSEPSAALVAARDDVLRHRPAAQVEVETVYGEIAEALAEFVVPGDLLVIGTHKTGFLHGRVLGSLGIRIAALVDCDLAIIPDTEIRFRSGVAVGIDEDPSSSELAVVAVNEAGRLDTDVILVQSDPRAGSPAGLRRDLAISGAVVAAHAADPEMSIRSRVTARGAAETLLDAARDKALLVLGSQRPSGVIPGGSPPLGSVLHDVLLNITSPVLLHHSTRSEALIDSVRLPILPTKALS